MMRSISKKMMRKKKELLFFFLMICAKYKLTICSNDEDEEAGKYFFIRQFSQKKKRNDFSFSRCFASVILCRFTCKPSINGTIMNFTSKVADWAKWNFQVRSEGGYVSNTELFKFSKLFEDELTLDNLSLSTLRALCRMLDIQPLGTPEILRFQLTMKLRELKADDQVRFGFLTTIFYLYQSSTIKSLIVIPTFMFRQGIFEVPFLFFLVSSFIYFPFFCFSGNFFSEFCCHYDRVENLESLRLNTTVRHFLLLKWNYWFCKK